MAQIGPKQADVVITGDVKYHEAQGALLKGLNVIDAGHQELERHMIALVSGLLVDESRRRGFSLEVIKLDARPCFSIL